MHDYKETHVTLNSKIENSPNNAFDGTLLECWGPRILHYHECWLIHPSKLRVQCNTQDQSLKPKITHPSFQVLCRKVESEEELHMKRPHECNGYPRPTTSYP